MNHVSSVVSGELDLRMIEVNNHPEGVVINIRVQPGARRDRIVGEYAGSLKVSVTQPPEKGKANQAVIDLLSAALSLKRSQVRVVSGETSRAKRLLLVGVDQSQLRERLAQLTGERDHGPKTRGERRKAIEDSFH